LASSAIVGKIVSRIGAKTVLDGGRPGFGAGALSLV
jgi:hypothetical protein